MSKHFFILMGTRPEAIKLFPVIRRLKAEPNVKVTVCVTAQHREMLDQVLELADIKPDIDLDLMEPRQSLDALSARILLAVGSALDLKKPDRVVVQGDTATAMVGALAAYYRRIPVAHVEAGLRSGDIYAPWPEEVNRKIVGVIADQHFAPTERAAAELVKENVPRENIYVTGNTVVDALLTIRQWVGASNCPWQHIRQRKGNRRLILVTAHRRENHGERLEHIVDALKQLLKRDDIIIVLPVHPNPNVQDVLRARLAGEPNVEIVSPPPYLSFVSLMMLSDIVLTDSGGIQEEAPTLGKPVLVLRDTTERPEGVEAGTAILVGSQTDRIVAETQRLLDCPDRYRKMSRAHSPFGDGHASERIVRAMLDA